MHSLRFSDAVAVIAGTECPVCGTGAHTTSGSCVNCLLREALGEAAAVEEKPDESGAIGTPRVDPKSNRPKAS